MKNLFPGIYEHYKGKKYEVIDVVHHSETLEELVLYKALYETKFGKESLWVRSLTMFLEKVKVDGKLVPRFKKLRHHASATRRSFGVNSRS